MKKDIKINKISQEIFQRLCGVLPNNFDDILGLLEID